VKTQRNARNVTESAFHDLYRYFTVSDPLEQPVPRAVLAADVLGQHAPSAPMWVYRWVNDELVPPADTDAVVAGYWARGGRVGYTRDVFGEHVALAVTGAADALNWLVDRLGGKAAASGCSTRTRGVVLGLSRRAHDLRNRAVPGPPGGARAADRSGRHGLTYGVASSSRRVASSSRRSPAPSLARMRAMWCSTVLPEMNSLSPACL
jgi:hypothetical protein